MSDKKRMSDITEESENSNKKIKIEQRYRCVRCETEMDHHKYGNKCDYCKFDEEEEGEVLEYFCRYCRIPLRDNDEEVCDRCDEVGDCMIDPATGVSYYR